MGQGLSAAGKRERRGKRALLCPIREKKDSSPALLIKESLVIRHCQLRFRGKTALFSKG